MASPSSRRRRRDRGEGSELGSLGPTFEERGSEVALGLALVFGVMAVGSVHVWTLCVLALLCGASALFAFRTPGGSRVPVASWICIALAAWSAVQATPLPMTLLDAIAPLNADVWHRSVEPAALPPPSWVSISLDPGASLRESLRWASYGCVAYSTQAIVHRRGQPWCASALLLSGTAVAVATVLHGVAGLQRVWGIYEPSAPVAPWHLGPLINPNNLAGYLNLTFLAGLGLALSPRAERRGAVALGLVVIGSVVLLSASRAGVALLVVGMAILAGVVWRWRRTRHPRRVLAVLAVACTGGILLALLGGSLGAWSELIDGSMDKLSMTSWLWSVFLDHPWVGIGRGAFESVSPAYQPLSGHVRFSHAEMFPLHWAIEWGGVVAGAAVLAFGFVMRLGRLRTLSTTGIALYVGACVLLIQNLFDLALEIPGVMVALAAAIGALDSARSTAKRRQRASTRARRSPLSLPLAVAAALMLTLGLGRRDLEVDRRQLRAGAEAATRGTIPAEGFSERLVAAVRRHPAEPYFPLLGALVAFYQGHQPVMPWLQRSLERGENDGRVHLLLAHVLARNGASKQALMELRFAVERDVVLRREAARLAVALSRDVETLTKAVPDGQRGIAMLDALAVELQVELPETARALDRETLQRDPRAVEARVRLAQGVIAELADNGRCATEPAPCVKEVEEHIATLLEVAPEQSASARVNAHLLAAQGKHDDAARVMSERCDVVEDRLTCWRDAVQVATRSNETRLLATAAEKVLAVSCADRQRCASTAQWLGQIYVQRGDWSIAMMYFQRAVSEQVSADRLLAYANAAHRAGASRKARRALMRALALAPDRKPEIERRLQELP